MKHRPSRATSRTFLLASVAASLTACGDVGRIRVTLDFDDEAVEVRTRALVVLVRAPTASYDGCVDLWPLGNPRHFPESVPTLVEYPSANDIVATAVDLSDPNNSTLAILLYAYATDDVESAEPIAGGCKQIATDPGVTSDVLVTLEKAP